jgi:hypothetical protein
MEKCYICQNENCNDLKIIRLDHIKTFAVCDNCAELLIPKLLDEVEYMAKLNRSFNNVKKTDGLPHSNPIKWQCMRCGSVQISHPTVNGNMSRCKCGQTMIDYTYEYTMIINKNNFKQLADI